MARITNTTATVHNVTNDPGLGLASRWVASYLDSYCGPGLHTFAGTACGVRWCTACYKEEAADGTTCLVCDARGEEVLRVRPPDLEDEVEGLVCRECLRGFHEGRFAWDLLAPGDY